jgi:hypothetical protein
MHISTYTRINIHAWKQSFIDPPRMAHRATIELLGRIYMRAVIYTRLLLALFLCVLDFNWVDVFIYQYQRRLGIRSCRFYVFDADGRIGSLKWKTVGKNKK